MKRQKIKYSRQDKINNTQIYSAFLKANLDDGWSKGDKIDNFSLLTNISDYTNCPLSQASVLDVGCGTGDLAPFLRKLGIKDYLGIDIFKKAIKKARGKYPKEKFINGDFLNWEFKDKFDFVFGSGILTTKLHSDNYSILKAMVKKMWKLSRQGIVFNVLLQRYPEDQARYLFLYSRKKVIEICASTLPTAQIKLITTDSGSGDGTEELHVFLYR